MKNDRTVLTVCTLGLAMMTGRSYAGAADKSTPGRDWPSVVPTPIVDVPMRDTAITRGPDGVYYLTGTPGVPAVGRGGPTPAPVTIDGAQGSARATHDFDNSRVINLWRSRDLKSWEEIGVVWDQDVEVFGPKGDITYLKTGWMRQSHKDPASADSPVVHGLKAPELHYIKGNWYICFSINDQGTGLLKSSSGKPEGPYEAHAQITLRHGDPSLFWDRTESSDPSDRPDAPSGKVYWLFGGGWISEMNEDLTAIIEAPRLLRTEYSTPPDWNKGAKIFRDHPISVGDHGVFLFKNRGRYYLTAAERTNRLNASCDTLEGPYRDRRLMIPHGGGVTVFRGPHSTAVPEFYFPQPDHFLHVVARTAAPPEEIEKGRADDPLYATFFGNDVRAIFRDRPAFIPLEWSGPERWIPSVFADIKSFPRKPQHVITERGPWPWMKPVIEEKVRDIRVHPAPNGKYYFGGSITSEPGKLHIWESDDLARWRKIGPIWTYEQIEWLKEKLPYSDPSTGRVDFPHVFWTAWPNWVGGNFYVTFGIFKPAGHEDHYGIGVLRSTTGKPEGPYESLGRVGGQYGPSPEPCFFEFFRVDDALWVGDWVNWRPVVAKVDESKLHTREGWKFNYQPVKAGVFEQMFRGDTYNTVSIANRPFFYFMSGGKLDRSETAVANTYDQYYVALESPTGPPKRAARPQVVPHNGAANVFQDHQGRWWSSMFSSDHSGPWWEQLGLVALRVEKLADGELSIDVEDHPDDEQKRIMGGGQIAGALTVQETIVPNR